MPKQTERIQTIFGDEAGYTGENMIDDSQPYFCYTTVAMEEKEAESIILNLRKKYKFQNEEELKGKSLFKRSDNVQIVKDLLSLVGDRFLTTIDHKKFTVCCRLFEYIYEPVLAKNNSIFYNNYFHLFLSNLFYMFFFIKDETAVKIFHDIYNYLRWGDLNKLEILFKEEYIEKTNIPMKYILRFAYNFKDEILDEFRTNKVEEKITTPDWMLDLSMTKVNLMLGLWGEKYSQLSVVLDESKPLFSENSKTCFKPMVERKGKQVYFEFGGKKEPITYNLVSMPELKSSKDSYGIQIADLISSMFLKSYLNFGKDENSKEIHTLFLRSIKNKGFLFPDKKIIQRDKYPLAFINSMVLDQIDIWIQEGIHPLSMITDFYNAMIGGVLFDPPEEFKESFSKYKTYDEMINDFTVS